MPRWLGREYAGVVASTPATPVSFTRLVSATDWAVLAKVEPASTGTLTAWATQAKRFSFSSSLNAEPSPVEPATTIPSVPSSTRNLASVAATSRSTEPSGEKGVTIAVKTVPNRVEPIERSYYRSTREYPPLRRIARE